LPHGASPKALVECPLCLERYPLEEALRSAPPLLKVIDDPEAGQVAVSERQEEFRLEQAPSAAPAFDFREAAAPSAKRPSVTPVTRPRREQKNPVVELVKIFGGGFVGSVLALLIIWWVLDRDVVELGPKVARVPFLRFLVPKEFRGDADEEPASQEAGVDSEDRPRRARDNSGRRRSPSPRQTANDSGEAPTRVFPVDDPQDDQEPPSPESLPANDDSPQGAPANDSSGQPQEKTPPNEPPAQSGAPGVRDAPVFSADQFDEALLAANQAREQFLAIENEAERSAAAANVYDQLADLAHITTYLSPADFGKQRREQKLRESLLHVTASPDLRSRIARIAEEQLGSPGERTGDGVVVIGKAASIDLEGKLFVTRIEPAEPSQNPILVHSYRDPTERFSEGDHVIVLGSIVHQPSNRLTGYAGSAAEVIWGGFPAAFPAD
jgi:hypothetical protein